MNSQIAISGNKSPSIKEFESLDLVELGLNSEDYPKVLEANKELAVINTTTVAEYGKNIASKTASYTDELLGLVKNKDLDLTGKKLNEVINVAQKLNSNNLITNNKSGILGFIISKIKNTKQNFDQQFNTTKEQMDTLVAEVETSQIGLKDRVELLEKMFTGVNEEYRILGIYIAAGKLRQAELKKMLDDLSSEQQNQTVIQQIYDLNQTINSLEKRIHDLSLLQQSALQTLPMIRIIQSNNSMLIDKFYAIKNITLPAWKNQISLALSLNEQKNSVELANNIDNATNQLLRRNADLLHDNSVKTAKANQRSVIDVETLEHVQNTLIRTVSDVIQIQKEGMAKRDDAEIRIKALQGNLNKIITKINNV
jgi:uncharacterized protein YaaN involved in tellurite resistance